MKIGLGTAQFGTKYGVSNNVGRVGFDSVIKILDHGKKIGIDLLDTAAAYGDSETVLGKVGTDGWNLVTKILPMPNFIDNVNAWVENQVELSMARLGTSKLAGVLLHKPEDLLGIHGADYVRALEKLRDSGKVDKVGYSIYSSENLIYLTRKFWPDLVQAPFNVFDQRIRTSGWLEKLKDRGTCVHARSVFLQGLLLMSIDNIPEYFKKWIGLIREWNEMASTETLSNTQAALNYVLGEDGFDRVIVGVDNVEQLQLIENAARFSNVNCYDRFASNELELIEPFRWKLK